MVLTRLYAQPTRWEPFLKKKALKVGRYEEGNPDYGVVYFTDVGLAVWNLAKSIFPYPSIIGGGFHLGDTTPGTIDITTPELKISLSFVSYKVFGGSKSVYVLLEINGKEEEIAYFVQRLGRILGRVPYEMTNWDKFRKKTGMRRNHIVENWEYYLNYKIEHKKAPAEVKEQNNKSVSQPIFNIQVGKIGDDAVRITDSVVQRSSIGNTPPLPDSHRSAISTIRKNEERISICPYCGKDLNFPKTPRFCPYCKEQISV